MPPSISVCRVCAEHTSTLLASPSQQCDKRAARQRGWLGKEEQPPKRELAAVNGLKRATVALLLFPPVTPARRTCRRAEECSPCWKRRTINQFFKIHSSVTALDRNVPYDPEGRFTNVTFKRESPLWIECLECRSFVKRRQMQFNIWTESPSDNLRVDAADISQNPLSLRRDPEGDLPK